MMTHEEIMKHLLSEAVDDQPTGWLSDNRAAEVDDEGAPSVIVVTTYSGDEAYIDLHHLAGIVLSLIEENR
jgi:hypothetical protein